MYCVNTASLRPPSVRGYIWKLVGFFCVARAEIWQFAGIYGVATSRFSDEFLNIYWPGRCFARIRGPTSFYILSQKEPLRWPPSKLGYVRFRCFQLRLDKMMLRTGQFLACVGCAFEISLNVQMPWAPPYRPSM